MNTQDHAEMLRHIRALQGFAIAYGANSENGQAFRAAIAALERHVELSPGVGEDVQRYALAVHDLDALTAGSEKERARGEHHHVWAKMIHFDYDYCTGCGVSRKSPPALAPQPPAQAESVGDDDEAMVPGDADDMAEALATISVELGCTNTLDDILYAIDGLKRTGVSIDPEWPLPCDVRVEPATTVRAGCKLSTLLHCIALRAQPNPVPDADPYGLGTMIAKLRVTTPAAAASQEEDGVAMNAKPTHAAGSAQEGLD